MAMLATMRRSLGILGSSILLADRHQDPGLCRNIGAAETRNVTSDVLATSYPFPARLLSLPPTFCWPSIEES
jgi:hypothetical protein